MISFIKIFHFAYRNNYPEKMAKKEKVEALIDGGKATAAPPLGQALGPLGVNIGEIISEINKKTEAYKGMKVPVTILVDPETREFEITIGTPPVSALIKKELGIEKGSGMPDKDKVGNLAIEDIIKIAKMKMDSLLVKTLKSAVKCVIGSCNSLGVLVEGKTSIEVNEDIDKGVFDKQIEAESTEVTAEKRELLKEQLEQVRQLHAKELEQIKAAEEEKKAKEAGAAAAVEGVEGAPAAEEKKEEKEEKKEEK